MLPVRVGEHPSYRSLDDGILTRRKRDIESSQTGPVAALCSHKHRPGRCIEKGQFDQRMII
ncbi:MAG: hypothetical protein C4293_14005, partial [Nitrospiraceae bacterium]